MEEYRGNSFKSREKLKDKRVEKVIRGKARLKKKSGMKKLLDIFVSEDVGDIKSYVIFDIVIPTIKKTISEIVTNGTDMILYGGNGRKSPSSKISYRSAWNETHRTYSTKRRGVYDYDDIIVDTRNEAEEILSGMDEIISHYGIVSVADLYDLVGETANHTDYKYGWTDIRNARVVRERNGYSISLPKALPID